MSTIDKQRIAAVRKLEQLGYTFAAGDWMHPTNDAVPAPAITDALHAAGEMGRRSRGLPRGFR
jgi:HAMP domain-containing protein